MVLGYGDGESGEKKKKIFLIGILQNKDKNKND